MARSRDAPTAPEATPDREREEVSTFGFDLQAEAFEARAGLGAREAEQIARAVGELAAPREGDVLLDVGAGTGEIGAHLARLPVRYVGLDRSRKMLQVFRRNAPAAARLQADAGRTWPLARGTVRIAFLARAAHLLPAGRLLDELDRVARRDGAFVLLGRVERDRESVRARMRQEMRARLRARGLVGRTGDRAARALRETLVARGGRALGPVVAARWSARYAPADALASWRSKPGLGGLNLPEPTKREVLADLEAWARAHYAALDVPVPSEERFVLQGAFLSRGLPG